MNDVGEIVSILIVITIVITGVVAFRRSSRNGDDE
jgi:hypothetical protein